MEMGPTMAIHIDGAAEQADVFRAECDIHAILDAKNTVKGSKVVARVEAGKERKKWLTELFNNVRALELASNSNTKHGGLHPP